MSIFIYHASHSQHRTTTGNLPSLSPHPGGSGGSMPHCLESAKYGAKASTTQNMLTAKARPAMSLGLRFLPMRVRQPAVAAQKPEGIHQNCWGLEEGGEAVTARVILLERFILGQRRKVLCVLGTEIRAIRQTRGRDSHNSRLLYNVQNIRRIPYHTRTWINITSTPPAAPPPRVSAHIISPSAPCTSTLL